MCQISRKDNKQVAKRDFYVYKIGLVLDNTFISLYQKYIYRIKRNNPIIPLKPVEDNCGMIKIEDGYHLCTFIVPKGSEYYINNRGEIVSSNIIYTDKWIKL